MPEYPAVSSQFPDEVRPNLAPVDPRKTASQSGDVCIAGSIDNESTFNLGTQSSTPSRF